MFQRWIIVLGLAVALAALGATPTLPAESPERPRVFLDTTYLTPSGRQSSVSSGGDLQGALNAAQSDDTLVLQAGTTNTGNHTLPARRDSEWIYIQISAAAGAHHHRFVGIEITTTWATTSATNQGPVALEAPSGDTALSRVPTDIVFDRCDIHGSATGNVRRGIRINSACTAVVDIASYNRHGVIGDHSVGLGTDSGSRSASVGNAGVTDGR